jgi:hypothetical protein
MARRRCVNVEAIPWRWGGGHLCSCPYGYVHLHGRHWLWWQCPACEAALG